MKDPLLTKLIKSWQFQRLSMQERSIELANYAFQKRTFEARKYPYNPGVLNEQR